MKPQFKIFSSFLVFSLLSGGILTPHYTEADVFANLFGNPASASGANIQGSVTGINSQSMGLLQANVSSAKIIEDKKNKNNKDKNIIDETKEITISDENSLLPGTGPMGVSDGTDNIDISSDQASVYVVRKDDTIAKISEMFGVKPTTIRWANDLKVGEKLVEGDVLVILPLDGVKVTVVKGDTLKNLAKKYKVDVADIAGFNGIAEDAGLTIGDELIVPNGVAVDEGGDKPIKNPSQNPNYKKIYNTKFANITGYFMNPVPGAKLSQGYHGRNSVDLAITKGTPIHASASGTIIFGKMGNNGGYGGLVIMVHPNGTQTLYGHMSKVIAHVGDKVSQGDVIGLVGSTGHSTGPHVHFEIKGAQNPPAFFPTGVFLDANWKY